MSVGAFKVGFYFYFYLRFLKARFRRLIEPSPEGASAKGRLDFTPDGPRQKLQSAISPLLGRRPHRRAIDVRREACVEPRLVQKMAGELISALGSGHRGTGCGT